VGRLRRAGALDALGGERIEQFGFVFVGTIRKDGGPRVNPVEAHLVEGHLALCMIRGSLKALDLLRDPRSFLRTPVLDAELGRPGELKLRARAVEVEDHALREAIADTLERKSGWHPPDDWHFFTLDVESAAFHRYDEEADLHHVLRWTPKRGVEASQRRYG
jgi:hypothetical protein